MWLILRRNPLMLALLFAPGLLISADANTGWSTEEAVQYVRAIAGSGLTFFEQPVAADDVAGMAAVAAAADCSIGADESIHSLGKHAAETAIRLEETSF